MVEDGFQNHKDIQTVPYFVLVIIFFANFTLLSLFSSSKSKSEQSSIIRFHWIAASDVAPKNAIKWFKLISECPYLLRDVLHVQSNTGSVSIAKGLAQIFCVWVKNGNILSTNKHGNIS